MTTVLAGGPAQAPGAMHGRLQTSLPLALVSLLSHAYRDLRPFVPTDLEKSFSSQFWLGDGSRPHSTHPTLAPFPQSSKGPYLQKEAGRQVGVEASRQATSRGTSDSYLKSRLIRLVYYVAGP